MNICASTSIYLRIRPVNIVLNKSSSVVSTFILKVETLKLKLTLRIQFLRFPFDVSLGYGLLIFL